MKKLLNIAEEWAIIKRETLERKPTLPIEQHSIEIREQLLKAQSILSALENTEDEIEQIFLTNAYQVVKDRYFFLVSSRN